MKIYNNGAGPFRVGTTLRSFSRYGRWVWWDCVECALSVAMWERGRLVERLFSMRTGNVTRHWNDRDSALFVISIDSWLIGMDGRLPTDSICVSCWKTVEEHVRTPRGYKCLFEASYFMNWVGGVWEPIPEETSA